MVKSTYYVLDAQGNQLSTYEHIPEDTTSLYQLAERIMYGSSRLGINTNKVDMLDENPEEVISLSLGNKLYEMSNHLGNVLTVINDIKVPQATNSVDVDGYLATIVSTADYSPFGVQLDGRTESSESYRYGFQGYEEDSEIKGQGNSYTTEYRQYDPRLGRWLSLDPLMDKYPDISPYASYANNPIFFIDVDGDSIGIYTVDKNGKFTHIKTIDSEDDYDMIYTVEDWNNKNYSNGEGIWDRTILATLSDPNQVEMTPCSGGGGCYPIKQPDGSYQYQTPVVTATGDANEINKLFFWLANNVNEHEFIVYQGVIAGKTVTTISTFVNHEFGRDHAPSYAMAGFQLAQVTMAIHNHPEKVWRDNRNTSERNSMGVRDDGKADGDWSVVITMYYSSGNKDPFPFYVYFQNSNNLYVITATKGPVLQGKITNHTQINYRGKKRK